MQDRFDFAPVRRRGGGKRYQPQRVLESTTGPTSDIPEFRVGQLCITGPYPSDLLSVSTITVHLESSDLGRGWWSRRPPESPPPETCNHESRISFDGPRVDKPRRCPASRRSDWASLGSARVNPRLLGRTDQLPPRCTRGDQFCARFCVQHVPLPERHRTVDRYASLTKHVIEPGQIRARPPTRLRR